MFDGGSGERLETEFPSYESPVCSDDLEARGPLYDVGNRRVSLSRPFCGTTSQAPRKEHALSLPEPHPSGDLRTHAGASELG